MRRIPVVLAIGAILAGLLVGAPAAAAAQAPAPQPEPGPTVYVGQLTARQLVALGESGVDRHDIATHPGAAGKVAVEVVLTRGQAAKLNAQGFGLSEKRVDGAAVSQRLQQEAASGYRVYRSYSEPGGIKNELVALAKQYP